MALLGNVAIRPLQAVLLAVFDQSRSVSFFLARWLRARIAATTGIIIPRLPLRRRKLLHQAKHIQQRPFFYHFATLKAAYGEAVVGHLLSRGRDAHEITAVGGMGRPAVQHLVSLGHLKVHGEVQIGKGRLEGDHELFPGLGAVDADEVIDVVFGVGCIQDRLVAAGKVFVEQAKIDGFVVG